MEKKESSVYTTILLTVGVGLLIFFPTDAYSSFHLWEINEIYSNADGTRQFIELTTTFDGQQLVGGHDINATSDGITNTFTFSNNTSTPTSNHSLLLATLALAASPGFPTPDFTIQSNFFEPTANSTTINFIGADSVTINGGIPTDGLNSVDDLGTIGTASPTNYDGVSAIPPFPPSTCSPPVSGDWIIPFSCTMITNATVGSSETWTINSDVVLTINPGVILTVDASGTLDISTGGTLNNSGIINNNSGGSIAIEGSLNNNNGAILNNNNGAILDNSAVLANNSGSVLINTGTLTNNNLLNNNSGATIFNFATLNNSAVINNSGNIINCGTYTGSPPSGNILLSCIISENITITSDATIPSGVSLMVDSDAVLTINPGITLSILSGQNITIKDGSGVLINSGGILQVSP